LLFEKSIGLLANEFVYVFDRRPLAFFFQNPRHRIACLVDFHARKDSTGRMPKLRIQFGLNTDGAASLGLVSTNVVVLIGLGGVGAGTE
jgi:hypothetical protein